jgi:hypothetical protein
VIQDQRTQNMNYYYNMPQNNSWHTETAVRFNSDVHGHYDMAPPYETRRHPSISYASRSEITPIAQHENPYGLDGGDILMDARPPERSNIVDLQGSREQRGSAFELYRKPVHHNLRVQDDGALFGSHPNIVQKLNTNSPKVTPKLTKTQSFKHHRTEGGGGGLITSKIFRKFSFKSKSRETTPKMSKKLTPRPDDDRMRPSKRDITSAIVDHRGGTMTNEYWGVSLEVPEHAIPQGDQKEIYFVISDPRLCDHDGPPLDLENGKILFCEPVYMRSLTIFLPACGPGMLHREYSNPKIVQVTFETSSLS